MDKPSAETLVAVWNFMKENSLAVATKESKIAEARSVEEIREAIGYRGTTGLFGR